MTTDTDTIRKAAILVSALDIDAADALLEQMPEEVASLVRMRLMEMDNVDAGEEQDVIGQFLGIDASPETETTDVVEMPISLEAFLATPTATSNEQPEMAASNTPFEFLHDAPEDQLFRALRSEHPQAVAVVLSHVPAEQAAAIMGRLPAATQIEVAQRMVDLEEIDAATLQEIETGLRHLIDLDVATPRSQSGLTAMRNILAAGDRAGELLENLQQGDARLIRQLDVAKTQPMPIIAPVALPPAIPTAQVEFNDLVQLSDADLGHVLQQAGGRVLLLALAGASAEMMNKVNAQLPRNEAESLRRQIEQQGPISLRDVEEAQRRIGRIAEKLAIENEIQIPNRKRFAVAA